MMRYQRVSPDYNPLSSSINGSKSSFRDGGESGTKTILTNGAGFRFRSPSRPPPPQTSQEKDSNINHYNNNNNKIVACASSSLLSDNNKNNVSSSSGRGGEGGGDVLLRLQWGHRKRARLSRGEIRSIADDSSSSSSIHRRGGGSPPIDKSPPLLHSHSLPPNASTRASLLRTKDSSGLLINRNIEDRAGAGNGSPLRNVAGGGVNSRGTVSRSAAVKGSPHPSEKIDKKNRREERAANHGSLARINVVACTTTTTATPIRSEQQEQAGAATETATVISMAERVNNVNVEAFEWPKIYVALSRKEKEDDFLAMKGTKLPHRPKKRAKNIDRGLQYCFPGMWLSDLTKSRYEVREKKSVKKQKRRGLKGMESDSE